MESSSWVEKVGKQGFVLTRFSGEVGVKSSRVRVRYERWILNALLRKLRRAGVKVGGVHYVFGRAYVPVDNVEVALKEASKVFGISSTSPAVRVSSSLSEVVEAVVKAAELTLSPGARFAVRCRRVGEHPYRSLDVVREAGSAVVKALSARGVKVSLKRPDVTLGVEVRGGDAYVYVGEVEGPGGLPAGCQGKAVCLMSSGLDSPVATWMAMRRGCVPLILHFDLNPFTGPETLSKVFELARVLAEWTLGGRVKVYVAKHGGALKKIKEEAPEGLTCVLCKRVMFKVACKLAEVKGAKAIVTGEIIAEQASQTLSNLLVVSAAATGVPIIRPLAGMDKPEVERLARRIGTYEVSAKPELGCLAAPKKPRTKSTLAEVEEVEGRLSMEEVVYREAEEVEEVVVESKASAH
ncbi:MAG: tRNA 4-thiouridine(8) synthase ThiI [Candidatus Nezhaarchaeota archaeon]|nr:tRNA 4-thiouridine(8) synthase ThiI [Candidatus Nezhaarchaeota archaeon]